MKILVVNPMTTPEYSWWWGRRINDNTLVSSQEDIRPIEEHLQLEDKKMLLGLDVDIHKLEVEKLRRGKNKAEKDLDSLKIGYKKLRLLMRTIGLGKTSEQWRQEIKEEKIKANQWGKKFQDTRAREVALERSLLECQNEKARLRAQSFLRGVMNSGKSSSIVLKARLEKETTLWAKLWLKYEK
ncbi:hypothetical protein Gotur_011932 [Gossypium turneri]